MEQFAPPPDFFALHLGSNRLIEDRHYDEAATLTVDLRDAALLSGREVLFQTKLAALRKQHARRKAYLERRKRLGLS